MKFPVDEHGSVVTIGPFLNAVETLKRNLVKPSVSLAVTVKKGKHDPLMF